MREVALIPLSRGLVATVDAADADFLNQWKWSASKSGGNGCKMPKYYAVRMETIDGVKKVICMHRALIGATDGQIVDHVDTDTLNNRRANLRLCTTAQNSLNSGPQRREMTSRYKGVYWAGHCKKWRARFRGKHIGVFVNEIDAAKAYDATAKAAEPEFAYTNFSAGGDHFQPA